MKTEFDTKQFQLSHGKAPRGQGHWVFFTTRSCEWGEGATFEHRGGFAEAKRAAAAWARAQGHPTLFVGP